jgi:hypothetical protein
MKKLIEFPFEGTDETVLIEIEEEELGFKEVVGIPEEITKASVTLEKSLDQLKLIAEVVLKKIKSISEKPEETSVSFGLKMSAQAGVVVASSSVEANFTVTMKWKKAEPAK